MQSRRNYNIYCDYSRKFAPCCILLLLLHGDHCLKLMLCICMQVSVMFNIKWQSNATLENFRIDFLQTHPNARPQPAVDVSHWEGKY